MREAEESFWTFTSDPGDPKGRSFIVIAADGTRAAAVLPTALHLLALGAAGLAF